MHSAHRHWLVCTLAAIVAPCAADAAPGACPGEQVRRHVLEEMSIYGPLSDDHEFFGFIYEDHDIIASAVIRGNACRNPGHCTLDTTPAARLIPHGAHVLGEWHTHPHGGAKGLSIDDVKGAWHNRHIRCYVPFYARPDGVIVAWDASQTSIPTATHSLVTIGSYTDPGSRAPLSANAATRP